MSSAYGRSAAALVLVLWAIAVLSLLAGGLSFAIRQDLAITNLQCGRLTAHVLARAGVERAVAALRDDSSSIDTLEDAWCDEPADMQEIALAGGTFSVVHGSDDATPNTLYGADDESGKLNVNVATSKQLMALPDMTEPIAAAIIDWRDRDDEPQPQGAEDSYYAALAHPYKIRNGPLRTVRELLLVRGVTEDLLYGEDLNANGLLDPNENDGHANPPDDNADGRLDRGWFAYLTVYSYEHNTDRFGKKRLNINSASAGQLSQRLNLENWAADSIVKARDKQNNKKFQHLVDLLDVKRDTSGGQSGRHEEDINARSDQEKNQPVTKEIFKRIVDQITLSDDEVLAGRVNLNTAPKEVIEALFGTDEDSREELANAIVQQRATGGGFTSIGQLLDVSGMKKEKFANIESGITVRSNVFRICSRGSAAGGLAEAVIECVVDRGTEQEAPRVLYWLESSP